MKKFKENNLGKLKGLPVRTSMSKSLLERNIVTSLYQANKYDRRDRFYKRASLVCHKFIGKNSKDAIKYFKSITPGKFHYIIHWHEKSYIWSYINREPYFSNGIVVKADKRRHFNRTKKSPLGMKLTRWKRISRKIWEKAEAQKQYTFVCQKEKLERESQMKRIDDLIKKHYLDPKIKYQPRRLREFLEYLKQEDQILEDLKKRRDE